jgi:hypothetical protein
MTPTCWYGPAPHVTATLIETHAERIGGIQNIQKIDDGKTSKRSLSKYYKLQVLLTTIMTLESVSHIVPETVQVP